jgi:hypothetical protein
MQNPSRENPEEIKVEEEDQSDFMCVVTGNTLPYTQKIQVMRFWGHGFPVYVKIWKTMCHVFLSPQYTAVEKVSRFFNHR